MHVNIAAISPFFAFHQSDLIGKIIVLLLLMISVAAWTIMLEKWIVLRRIIQQSQRLFTVFDGSASPGAVLDQLDSFSGPLQHIVGKAADVIAASTASSPDQVISALSRGGLNSTLDESACAAIRVAIDEALDNEILKMERNMSLLGSIVSSSPYIGLLGTVWGVMMAFSGMAVRGRADINAIAPGVSGALLTTVVALIVAIPSLIGYNHLTATTKFISYKFEHFNDRLFNAIKALNRG